MRTTILLTVLAVALLPLAAHGGVIAATDFDGRVVSGATASNLTWTLDGVADPGSLTATHNLFDTADAQNRFAVDRNLHNEGSWSVDVPLDVGGLAVGLETVTLDVFIYSNAGGLQGDQRDVDMTVELLNAASAVLDSDTVLNIYANSGPATQPQSVALDLSGNLLTASADYTLRLTTFGQGPGNNAGIDNLAVSGTVTPEPATLTLLALGGVGLLIRRRQR
jgi:hypothetical protein